MKPLDIRGILVLMLTGTICSVVLMTMVTWTIVGPERVPDIAREHLYDLILLLMGIISGYMMGTEKRPGPGRDDTP